MKCGWKYWLNIGKTSADLGEKCKYSRYAVSRPFPQYFGRSRDIQLFLLDWNYK
jgi:hypothetical protein